MADAFQAVYRVSVAVLLCTPFEMRLPALESLPFSEVVMLPTEIGSSCYRASRLTFRALGLVRVNLLLCSQTGLLVPRGHVSTLPLGSQQPVPEDEEGLGEVGLDAPALVVDVMVGGIVGRDVLQWIPRERVPAVVVDGLDGGEGEEPHALTAGHARSQEGDARACGVQEESLDRVVIERPKRVGHVEAVMAGVERHYPSQNRAFVPSRTQDSNGDSP